jgi:hypothetical protein
MMSQRMLHVQMVLHATRDSLHPELKLKDQTQLTLVRALYCSPIAALDLARQLALRIRKAAPFAPVCAPHQWLMVVRLSAIDTP